jgi:hypothetical protein
MTNDFRNMGELFKCCDAIARMTVGKSMLWLGDLKSLNERDGRRYELAGQRISRTYFDKTFDASIDAFCRQVSGAGGVGVVYFSIEKEWSGAYYVKGYPVKKK